MGNRRPATEPAFANTRYPQRGCRAVCFICSVILAGTAFGGEGPSGDAALPRAQETGCEQVPASRREQCLKVMSCLAVDDDDVRRACIEAAQRPPSQSQPVQPPPEADPAEVVQPTQQPPEAEPVQIVRPTQQRENPPPRSPEPPPGREEPIRQPEPVIREETIEPSKREGSRTRAEAVAPNVSPQEPADEFEGTISRIYQSILDRQLIAVDSKYLFESDRASHARLEEGERVAVAKVSSRFWTGRKWRITGSSRTPVVGYRIRCEKQDIRSEDRRKCRQMLDR